MVRGKAYELEACVALVRQQVLADRASIIKTLKDNDNIIIETIIILLENFPANDHPEEIFPAAIT